MWLFEIHISVFLEPRAYKSTCFASYIKFDNRNNEFKHMEGQIKPAQVNTENLSKARLTGMFHVPISKTW
jgi:hypothetical protein